MLNSRYDRGERTTTTSTHEETGREATHSTESKRADTNGEQTESVIEPEHFDEELLAQFTRLDDEAGSIVLHVSCDTNEKEKVMKKQTKQKQQKKLRRYQERRGYQKTHRGEKKHTQGRETAS